jgi:hypothetical protein
MPRKSKTLVSEITSPPPPPLLLDIPAAAKVMNVGPWAIRSLLWGRKLPFVKIGKKHLIDPADLRMFIDKTKATA